MYKQEFNIGGGTVPSVWNSTSVQGKVDQHRGGGHLHEIASRGFMDSGDAFDCHTWSLLVGRDQEFC